MSQTNVDLGIFQDKKVTKGIYLRESGGYQVVLTKAPSMHRGGVAVFYSKADHFNLEVLHFHIPNVFSFHLAL